MDDGCTVCCHPGRSIPTWALVVYVCVFFFYLLKTGQNKIKKKTWNSCWVDRGRRVNFIWYYAKTSKRENKILNQTSQGLDVYMSSFLYPFWFVFFCPPLSLSPLYPFVSLKNKINNKWIFSLENWIRQSLGDVVVVCLFSPPSQKWSNVADNSVDAHSVCLSTQCFVELLYEQILFLCVSMRKRNIRCRNQYRRRDWWTLSSYKRPRSPHQFVMLSSALFCFTVLSIAALYTAARHKITGSNIRERQRAIHSTQTNWMCATFKIFQKKKEKKSVRKAVIQLY